MGSKFKEAIKDLNIVNISSQHYNVTLHFSNGMIATAKREHIDLFAEDNIETLYLEDKSGRNFVDVTFNTSDCKFDTQKMMNVIYPENLIIKFDDGHKDLVEQAKNAEVEYLSFTRVRERRLHYAV